ncbi:hypothetical protein [Mucilaginibacter pedocola]|uniref:Uncharacterized protein n=1 Tax=Mucilaginibacter pedocola TaxID=1792845 RepID=A0A1S9PMB3_9SPHI|nr:hypothetical protein [Mucilaginibacter pedocola]OOQ61698.1 hypothetical protein BC343_01085 [Mucilaginibacter pedocola]
MTKYIVFIIAFCCSTVATAQNQDPNSALVNRISTNITDINLSKDVIQKTFDEVFSNPDILNDATAKLLTAFKGKPGVMKFMRDLNFKFKTFQTDNQPASLGFEYKYENSWSKFQTVGSKIVNQSISLNFNGNVAFKKSYNPANFLESKFQYNGTFNWGAKSKQLSRNDALAVYALDRQILPLTGTNSQALADLLVQRANYIHFSNQYYIGASGNMSYESNQDFSKHQLAPGVLLNVGAKAWDKNGTLQYFNLLDYPFALIRYATGDRLYLSGASFPSALVGVDYVVPTQDSVRKALTGNLDPFSRFRFEISFKTKAVSVAKQVIYFSADYRLYKEINASEAIKNNGTDRFNYFVMSLESNNGFFVHFTTGKLPFDRKSDNTYGIGFHYDLGNWK